MSRYIDAEDVEKSIDIALERFTIPNGLQDRLHNQIGAVPTADVAEVVRCKDCKYNGTLFNKPICALLRMLMKPDDFCCKGKLKTQEQELENDALSKELNKFGKEYVEGGLRKEQGNECK